MHPIDRSKASYFFDSLPTGALPEAMTATVKALLATESLYHSATREIATKLENLNDELKHTWDGDPCLSRARRQRAARVSGLAVPPARAEPAVARAARWCRATMKVGAA